MSTAHEIALMCMLQKTPHDNSTLVQVMTWCHQAASHYLSLCWQIYVAIWHEMMQVVEILLHERQSYIVNVIAAHTLGMLGIKASAQPWYWSSSQDFVPNTSRVNSVTPGECKHLSKIYFIHIYEWYRDHFCRECIVICLKQCSGQKSQS